MHSYKQKAHKEITEAYKNRLYNVWIDKKTKQTYLNLASFIYEKYLDVILENYKKLDEDMEDWEDDENQYITRDLNLML